MRFQLIFLLAFLICMNVLLSDEYEPSIINREYNPNMNGIFAKDCNTIYSWGSKLDPQNNITFAYINKTTNGGKDWNYLWLEKYTYKPSNGIVRCTPFDIQVLDSINIIALCDSSKILRTSNGGKTWDTLKYDTQYNSPRNIIMKNQNFGIITTKSNYIFITYDGCKNWKKVNINKACWGAYISDDYEIKLLTISGKTQADIECNLEFSKDSCNTFEIHKIPIKQTNKVYFYNDKIAFAVGGKIFNLDSADNEILKSIDGGLTWQKVMEGEGLGIIYSIGMSNSGNAWATNNKTFISFSKNYGETWEKIEAPDKIIKNYAFDKISATNDDCCFISLSFGANSILKYSKTTGVIEDIISQDNLVFPNPVKSGKLITIESNYQIETVSLYDLMGLEYKVNCVDNTIQVPEELLNGIYFIKYRENGVLKSSKIIVE